MNTTRLIAAALTGLMCAFAIPAAFGATSITYTIDPTHSSLTLSGTAGGLELLSQNGLPSSLVTSYTGSMTAERDFQANTLQIDGANIVAQNNGSFGPISNLPANYGFITQTGGGFNAEKFWGTAAGFSFSLSSPVIADPSTFDVSKLSRNAE